MDSATKMKSLILFWEIKKNNSLEKLINESLKLQFLSIKFKRNLYYRNLETLKIEENIKRLI